MTTEPVSPAPMSPEQRDKLRSLSSHLLQTHKLLLDLERARYEQMHGPITSTGEFLNLVLSHVQFEWLRQLSGVIVELDEITAPRSKAGAEEATAAMKQVRELMVPAENGSEFQRNYWRSIQDSPDVVFAHRELGSLF